MHDARRDPHRQAWLTLSVVCLVSVLMALNMSSLNMALPALSRHFDATAVEGSWLLLSYMVTSTACLLLFGRLTDIVGQRRLYLVGLTTFTVANFACGFAPTVEVLIALRVVASVGGAILLTNGATLVHEAFPKHLMGHAMGLYSASFSVANLVGPTVGGMIVELGGWRWVFWFSVPLCLVGLLWGHRSLRARPRAAEPSGVDGTGNALILVILLLLTSSISLANDLGWTHVFVWGSLLVSAGLVPALVLVERRTKDPVLDFSILRHNGVASVHLAGFFNGAARAPIVTLMSLYYQSVLSSGPVRAGVQLLPLPIASILSAALMGRLSHRYGPRALATLGSFLGLVGTIVLSVALAVGQTWLLYVALALVGSGSGLFIGSNATALLDSVPGDRMGTGNALRLMLQNTGNVISLALALTIVTGVLPADLRDAVLSATTPASQTDVIVNGFEWAIGYMCLMSAIGLYVCRRSQAHEQRY